VNLRLPSGTAKSWANLDYDVNIMLADRLGFVRPAGLHKFEFRRLIGDRMTVNMVDNPVFSRWKRASIASGYSMRPCPLFQAGSERRLDDDPDRRNDGNLLPHPCHSPNWMS